MKKTRITIHRPHEHFGMLRKLWIFVDGEKTAYVKNGKTVDLEVDPGKHEIFISSDYLKSNRLELDLNSEEEVILNCGSTLRGIRFYLSLFFILAAYIFKGIKIFYLKRV